jgi:hypothetical protein
MDEYLIFGSEYGTAPDAAIKGRRITDLKPETIDSLIRTLKSNWIIWDRVLSDDPREFRYRFEKEDVCLAGQLLQNDDQLSNPGEFVFMSTPGKVPLFKYATTNYEGRFFFYVHIDEEVKDLIIQPDNFIENNKFYIESPFSDQFMPSEINTDSTLVQIPAYIQRWSVNYQVGKNYEFSTVGGMADPSFRPIIPKRFYGKPDAERIITDYVKLPTMEELFFEIVPNVSLKKNRFIYEMKMVDPLGNVLYEEPPVMMIDGVIVKDASVIAGLNPEFVEKIDVVHERYYVGDFLFNGIVNVITRSGDFSRVLLPAYATRLPYRVIDPVRMFVSPDYSSSEMRNSRIPDFRNTVYWNPSVKPDKKGKASIDFWTSDIKTEYEVNIQGITEQGKAISFHKIINVK